jgi:hypothetical protein
MIVKKIFSTLIITLSIFSVFAPRAHAYMDPGTGSLIFQLIIAGAIGGLFILRRSWTKIIGYCRQVFSGKEKNTNDS